jgi:hypothetical protein
VRAGVRIGLLVVLPAVAALVPPAAAGELNPAGEGRPAGRFILYPSLTVDISHDSNLFRVGDVPGAQRIASGIVDLKPRILVDLPLGESRIRWAYAPVVRDYTTGQFNQSDRLSHYFDLDTTLVTARALRIGLRDHFVRGTTELQEIDQGRELRFGLVPFRLHEPSLEVTMDLGARSGFSAFSRYSWLRFDETETGLFDYRKRGAEGRYNYRVTPSTTLYTYLSLEHTEQDRDPSSTAPSRISARSAGVGLRRTLNQAVVTALSVGYERFEFDEAAGSAFTGLVLDAAATWLLNDVTRLEIAASRQPFQSFTIDGDHYVSTGARFRLTRQIGRSAYAEVGPTYFKNTYGSGVRDHTVRLEGGIGYRFLRTLRAFVGYNAERRDSNLDDSLGDPFHYGARRVVFRLEAGWM